MDRAVPGAAMAHHVRRPLAHRPGQHGLDYGREWAGLILAPAGDPRRGEQFPGTRQFAGERRLAVAADCLAYLAQRPARQGDRIHQFPLGTVGVDAHEALCELIL